VISASPGVRRLCVCVRAPQPGLLDIVCRTAGFGRLYVEHVLDEGLDLGFASPGVDEATLVTDMITALHTETTRWCTCSGHAAGARGPTLAAFHVGITRVEGDDLRGAAVTRIRELLRNLTRSVTSSGEALVVGISAGLFDDIRTECGFGDGWGPLEAARSWFRVYQATGTAPPARS
jgi:hypothetical protein